ncbi:MAG: hypothetical protein CVU97_05040 [Firmicutes bacterium HGW-Firmicutes-21]|nr:MAG: hypothetical protein CVU97_05040 [Firmicutes bacterium HGW-Firmicutes-21]
MIALDARMRCIYEAVGKCECIADIGSDHGLLPVAMLLSGRAKRGIASDINKGPLERSRSTALKHGVKNIEFVLSDGFNNLRTGSFDKAAVCGMGGALIADIIARGGEKAHCELVLQPMTAYEELRAFLWDNGFRINDESFAVESGKPYIIISALYTGEREPYGYCDLYLGKKRPDTAEYVFFCKKVSMRAKKRLQGALHTGMPTADIEELIFVCDQTIY